MAISPRLCSASAQSGLLFIVSVLYLAFAPYTKVEESFSMQAVHDYLFLSDVRSFPTKLVHFLQSGSSQTNHSSTSLSWDHEFFPGVVHRTFFGPFVIAFLTKPLQLLNILPNKFFYQVLSRICLAGIFTYAYHQLNKEIAKVHGTSVSQWVTWLTLSQFHFLFYSSRTLPNTFALISVMLVYSAWLTKRWSQMISLIAFTVVVLRFETILLFGCILLVEVFYTRQLSVLKTLKVGIPSGLLSLAFTIGFDSFMWGKWMWPEGDGILFNIVHNKSNEWGTQPFFWYFYSVLPRMLLFSTMFALMPSFYKNKYAFVGLLFVLIYSILPHKELRFVVYVLPLLNLCASNVIVKLLQLFCKLSQESDSGKKSSYVETKRYNLRNRKKTEVDADSTDLTGSTKSATNSHILAKLIVTWSPLSLDTLMVLHLLVNLVLSMFMFYVSANNYPGGESLNAVNEAIRRDLDAAQYSPKDVSVYVSNLAAQSGFTRFLQQDGVYYNKEPQFSVDQFESFSLIYLVLEPQQKHLYLRQCTAVGSGGGRGHTCQLASTAAASKATTAVAAAASSSPSSRFECHWQRNTTAFDRIDLQRRTVNFRTFLLIYRCHKVAANF